MVEDDEIRAEARGDGPQIVEPEILGRVEGSHLKGEERIETQPDRLSHHRIDVPFIEKFSRMAIIRDEEESSRIRRGHEREQIFQVSCRRSFTYHDPQAVLQFLFGLCGGRAFMVGSNPGDSISVKTFS